MEADEKEAIALLQQAKALRKDQIARRRQERDRKLSLRKRVVEKEVLGREGKKKRNKLEHIRAAGIKRKRNFVEEEGRSQRRRISI